MKITEAENMVRAELGSTYSVVKLSGYWIINNGTTQGHAQSRSLPRAIATVKAAR